MDSLIQNIEKHLKIPREDLMPLFNMLTRIIETNTRDDAAKIIIQEIQILLSNIKQKIIDPTNAPTKSGKAPKFRRVG